VSLGESVYHSFDQKEDTDRTCSNRVKR
jgi:hypothetical protein